MYLRLQRHFGIELAVVADFDLGQMGGVLLDQIGKAQQQPTTLRGPQATPFAFECPSRRLDCTIDIGRVAMRNLGPWLARIRIDALKPFGGLRIGPISVDVMAILLHRSLRRPGCETGAASLEKFSRQHSGLPLEYEPVAIGLEDDDWYRCFPASLAMRGGLGKHDQTGQVVLLLPHLTHSGPWLRCIVFH